MDNLGSINPGGQRPNEPIPFDDGGAKAKTVSHAPLDLGGASQAPAPQSIVPKPVVRPSVPPAAIAAKAVAVRPAAPAIPAGRIQGVKTFFTKLHPGAISFLDEQITRWLTENPNVIVKQTNIAVGEVEAKKTEPNIIITVWF